MKRFKISASVIGVLMAAAVLISAAPAWAIRDADLELTPRERQIISDALAKSAAKIDALAKLMVQMNVSDSCVPPNVRFGLGAAVKCVSSKEDRVILSGAQIEGSAFQLSPVWGKRGIAPVRYELIYTPFEKKDEIAEYVGAVVTPEEASRAIEKARLEITQKAVEKIGGKLEGVRLFDSSK